MQEEFLKEEKKIIIKNDKELNTILIQSIINTYNSLEVARKNYEFAEDDLIDYYLYEMKSNQAKLNYLLKQSKRNGIELDRIEKIQIMNLEENQVG